MHSMDFGTRVRSLRSQRRCTYRNVIRDSKYTTYLVFHARAHCTVRSPIMLTTALAVCIYFILDVASPRGRPREVRIRRQLSVYLGLASRVLAGLAENGLVMDLWLQWSNALHSPQPKVRRLAKDSVYYADRIYIMFRWMYMFRSMRNQPMSARLPGYSTGRLAPPRHTLSLRSLCPSAFCWRRTLLTDCKHYSSYFLYSHSVTIR